MHNSSWKAESSAAQAPSRINKPVTSTPATAAAMGNNTKLGNTFSSEDFIDSVILAP